MNIAQRSLLIVLIVVLLLIVPLGRSVMFTVDERELAVVKQFGKVVESYTEPGLRFKVPFVQEVQRLPKTLQFWSGADGDILVDLPTADGKKIEVTPWFIWRITDPKQFVEVLRTVERAETRVKEFVRSEMRDVITANVLAEVVRSTDRELTYTFQVEPPLELEPSDQSDPGQNSSADEEAEATREPLPIPAARQPGADEPIEVGREKLVQQINEVVRQRLSTTAEGDQIGRGIELVEVGIAKIDFVDAVREAAFERLTAFMQSIAARYTNEGERRKQEILNKTNYEVDKIEGEGKGEANRIRGEVDAEIIEKYAEAIRETGDFYRFVRTLEAYQQALGPNTRLVLTTDSEMFKLLKAIPPAPPPSGEASTEASSQAPGTARGVPPEKPAAKKPSPEKPPAEEP
jgi:membrane protease subunit HflC